MYIAVKVVLPTSGGEVKSDLIRLRKHFNDALQGLWATYI